MDIPETAWLCTITSWRDDGGNRWKTLSSHWAVAPSLASLLVTQVKKQNRNCQDTRLKHKMWDEPFNSFHLPYQSWSLFERWRAFGLTPPFIASGLFWLREVTVGQGLTKRLQEFSAGLRVAEEERRRPLGQNGRYSLLFVFQSVCACLQHWRIHWGKIKPEVGGRGCEKTGGDPPQKPPLNPLGVYLLRDAKLYRRNRCAFRNAV